MKREQPTCIQTGKEISDMSIKNQSGFSLIEILIVIVMFSILAIVATQTTISSLTNSRKSDSSTEVRQNLEYAASVVERNVRNASVITTPCSVAGTVTSNIGYLDKSGATGSFLCQSMAGGSYLAQDNANTRLTSTNIVLTTCQFTCTSSGRPQDPPEIRLDIVGQRVTTDAVIRSPVSISTVIYLRTY